MKKVLLALLLSVACLSADELNVKFASYVEHYMKIDGFKWNEGFENSAKGIEYIKTLDENHGVGLTYITFENSFYKRTHAGGIVYKYTSSDEYFGVRPNTKLYGLYQKGYYGSWDNIKGYDRNGDNKFFTPMVSVGAEWQGFTIDAVGTKDTLSAIAFGYSLKF